jgi:hypothetical protein
MVSDSVKRMAVQPVKALQLTLTPPPRLPESFLARFQELRQWDEENFRVHKLNERRLREHLGQATTT